MIYITRNYLLDDQLYSNFKSLFILSVVTMLERQCRRLFSKSVPIVDVEFSERERQFYKRL
jgi:hypothetical protein